MGKAQKEFVSRFRGALKARFANVGQWSGGQCPGNTAAFREHIASLHRDGRVHPAERFELGDLRCSIGTTTIIVEYDGREISLSNLLKYWPYLRGDLSEAPSSAIALCHFSGWFYSQRGANFPIYRDLWDWLYSLMKADPALRVRFVARQFDHGGTNPDVRDHSIAECLNWLEDEVLKKGSLRA